MKTLIIGGAGYIGSHVVREFLDSGVEATVFDNLSSGLKENLFPEASFEQGDILDYPGLLAVMGRGFDAIIHLAAFKAAGESMISPEKYARNNISGTVNILNAACETGIKKIVFSSSAAIYGEPAYLPIDEKHPTKPENFYGFTKLEIERFLSWYDKLKGIKYAALRYFNAAGYDPKGRVKGLERNPANLIPILMEIASGWQEKFRVFGTDYGTPDGTCIRDYVHVGDLARAHRLALEYLGKKGESLVVNLGSENGLSVLEVLDVARRVTGKPIPSEIAGRRPGDGAKLVASSALARSALGWKASLSDADTLVRTSWDAYRRYLKKPY